MKVSPKGFGKASTIRFVVGCLIGLAIAFIIPAGKVWRLSHFFRASQIGRVTGRHTVLDFTDSRQDKRIHGAGRAPASRRERPAFDAVGFVVRRAQGLLVVRDVLAFSMRRKLLSHSTDPDPLVQPG